MSDCMRAFRFGIKTGSGLPTIPVSSDHQNGDWIDTDIYEGEMYQDTDTGYVYTRFGATIIPSSLSMFVVTHAEFLALSAADELVVGAKYQISDVNISVVAATTKLPCPSGCRKMRIVKDTYYTPAGINIGVWNNMLTPTAGDIVVWGGKCWSNVAGAVGTATDESTLSAAWSLIATTNDTYYQWKAFFVLYDYANNWVSRQFDDRGNELGAPFVVGYTFNPCDISDWGNNQIFDNKCHGVYNNANYDNIYNNICATSIYSNTTAGEIASNVIYSGGIFENSNGSSISQNVVSEGIYQNSNGGSISLNTCFGIASCANTGDINFNSNNGSIGGIGAANSDIINNINNGNITTTTTGVISDTIVNK